MSLQVLNSLVTVIMFGGLLLLAFVKLVNPLLINRKGNFFFGLLLVMWASFWLEEIIELVGIESISVLFIRVLQWLQIFAPLFLYLSIRFYSNQNYKFVWKDAKHLIIPFIFLVIIWMRLNHPGQRSIIAAAQTIVMFFQAFFYVILSFIKIKQHRKKLVRFESNIQGKDMNWIEYIILQILIISVIALVNNVMSREAPGLLMNTINLFVVFIVAFYAIGQKEIFPIYPTLEDKLDYLDEPETKRKLIPDDELDMLKSRLTNLMLSQKTYLDSDLNLVKLSELLNLSPHKLSYTINTGLNLNFFQFVNQYRIEKAKEFLLNNAKNYTILAIAYESGFNSKTAFNTTFKKLTGQTPTEFKKQHTS